MILKVIVYGILDFVFVRDWCYQGFSRPLRTMSLFDFAVWFY